MDNLKLGSQNMHNKGTERGGFLALFIGITILAGLYLISLFNYLLFHTLLELITVVIVSGIFILTWNVRGYLTNNYLKVIGFCYGFIAIINLFHALSYGNINLVPGYGANLSIQFWMAEAYLLSISILMASFFIGGSRLNDYSIVGFFAIVTSVLLIAIFFGYFPLCFIEGKGLTTFKVYSEYVVTVILIISFFPLYRKRDLFNKKVFYIIVSSLVLTIISEIFFSGYTTLFDSANLIGHMFKAAAFCFIHQAILITGLREPFNVIFLDLKQAERRLHTVNETLEQKIIERTSELAVTNKELRDEIAVRKLSEEKIVKLIDEQKTINQELTSKNIELKKARTATLNIIDDLSQEIAGRTRAEEELRKSEAHYYDLFEDSPISLWEEDFSESKKYIDELKAGGVSDFRKYFEENPEELNRCVNSTKIVSINKATVKLFKADSKESLLKGLEIIFTDESLEVFKEEIIALASGMFQFQSEAVQKNLAGENLYTVIKLTIAPGYENTWEKVFVSLSDISDRKRIEEELRNTVARLNEAQHIAHIGNWELNLTTNLLLWSDEIYRIFEIDPEKFGASYEAFLEAIHPDDREAVNSAYTNSLKTKTPYNIDHRLLFPDGRIKYVHEQCETLYDEFGNPYRSMGIVQDISERKLIEESLRESEYKLGEAARIAHVGYWDRDYVAQTIILSEEACKIFDLPARFQTPKLSEWHPQWLKFIHPDDQPKAAEALADALADKKPYNIEYRVVISDGSIKYVHSFAEVTKDKFGKPIRMFGTMLDITERKHIEEAIRKREHEFHSLAENSPDNIMRYDIDCRMIYANSQPETTAGYDESDFMGKTPLESNPNGFFEGGRVEVANYQAALQAVLSEGSKKDVEMHIPDGSGGFRLHAVRIAAERDSEGNIVGALAFGRDITERKLAEENLTKSEEWLRLTLETAKIGIWDWDVKNDLWYASPTYYTMLGYEPKFGNADRSEWIERVHPEDIALVNEKIQDVLAGNSDDYSYEARMRHSNGTYRWQYVAGFGLERDEYSKVTRMLGIRMDIEERMRAEEALLASELRYRTLVENTPDLIVRYDTNLRRIYVNPAWEKASGLSSEEVINVNASDILRVPNPVNHKYLQKLQDTLNTGTSQSIEFWWTNALGNNLFVEYTISPEYDRNGKVVSLLSIGHDITERKHAVELLRKREQEFRTLAENSPDVIVRYDIEGRRIYVNPEFERINHISAKEVLGKTPIEFSTELAPKADFFIEKLMAVMASGTAEKIDLSWTKNGRRICWFVRVVPEFDVNGKVVSALTIWSDISQRKLSEEALRKSESGLKEAQRLGRLGSWDWDATTDTIHWSEEYYRIYGLDPLKNPPGYEEHLKAYTPESAARLDAAVKKNMETGEPYELDLEIARSTEQRRWVTARSETKRNADGQIVGLRGTTQDITDRKKMEEEIRELNRELELRVIQRTAQLETANKELEAFAYSVSHDLRAPIRHIDGFLEMLYQRISGNLDKESKHYVDTISNATKRMSALIDDLLSFSRMGRTEMTSMPVNLTELLGEVILELTQEVSGREIIWKIDDLPVIIGDRSMLRIVLTNLVSNALKFTRLREHTEIEIGSSPGKGNETIIFIRDNGAGFDMAYSDKLFGVFQRLHRIDQFEGTGIGLANVKRIINRHGGKTWAEGIVNQGAVFYFSLPQITKGA